MREITGSFSPIQILQKTWIVIQGVGRVLHTAPPSPEIGKQQHFDHHQSRNITGKTLHSHIVGYDSSVESGCLENNMKNLIGVLLTAFAAMRKPVTWLIDGNNVLLHKRTPRCADVLSKKLMPMDSLALQTVVAIFGGREGDTRNEMSVGKFRRVHLGQDEWVGTFMAEEVDRLFAQSKRHRVNVVTSNRGIRRMLLAKKPTVRDAFNPRVFWRRHFPRLAGIKKVKADARRAMLKESKRRKAFLVHQARVELKQRRAKQPSSF